MGYANKVTAGLVATVLFLVVVTAPKWTEAQPMPEVDPICAISIPEIVKHCYATTSVLPSEECCTDLKTASKREVTCLCDNFFAHPHPVYDNITKVFFEQVNIACGVLDKYAACDGGKGGNVNGGSTNRIAATMGLFGLVASLFF